jgi:hypothetical protein
MWLFQGKEIKSHEDLHPDCTDFVYIITYTTGQKYLGKKTVRSIRRKKPTKTQLAKRKNYVRKEITNLPFLDYEGSSNLTKELEVEGKEILYQCSTKKAATYLETALLFYYNAIFDNEYLNENINGRYFNNDLDGLLEI